MHNNAIQIFWNSSHLWGLMAKWTMDSLGIPCQLVSAREIAQGSLMRNPPALLLVPGGSARQKALALGHTGIKAVRDWIAKGGMYLGFCGGAGLALTPGAPDEGLGLCPWQRNSYSKRVYHLISGHVLIDTQTRTIPAAVWWPGRFEPAPTPGIEILARYLAPTEDLWVADMPLTSIPHFIREGWQEAGFLDADLHLPKHHPLAVTGKYGNGRYLLSYAHLETPASPAANEWLVSLLDKYANIKAQKKSSRKWNFCTAVNENTHRDIYRIIGQFYRKLRFLINSAISLGLFFDRTSWLFGWHPGFPGMVFNHLLWCAYTFLIMEPIKCIPEEWIGANRMFGAQLENFCREAETYIWTYKLENTLHASSSHMPVRKALPENKIKIFGNSMGGGGLAQDILNKLETLIFHAQRGEFL